MRASKYLPSRHEFYETDDKVTLSIFDKGADPTQVSVKFDLRKVCINSSLSFHASYTFFSQFTYTNGDKSLVLEPLKGQIVPESSDFTVGKVKVEVRFVKAAHGRWGSLIGDAPDRQSPSLYIRPTQITPSLALSTSTFTPAHEVGTRKPAKNWEGITTNILNTDKEKTIDQDPNVGGDASLNSFFQKIFADADDDTKKAMMKSYQESGGTSLSTNWDEVKKERVEVKPPAGSEWKRWG